jgi:micrococcal nuclease
MDALALSRLCLLALCATLPAHASQSGGAATAVAQTAQPVVAAEVARVVDGDTIHAKLDGKLEKLRLLCVDTEEKVGSGASSATKPATVFGEECALWAQRFFADLGRDGAPARIGLAFPHGERRRDVYGRLLCHVILPDGTDYNVLLVRLGKSPYFTKYGYSELCHDEFAAAQKEARAKQSGIWNPKTNQPATADTPMAARPYARLLPWWDARAEAVAAFHARRAREPAAVCEAESAGELESAAQRAVELAVFGEVDKVFDEDDGSRTLLFRAIERERALRVRIPAAKVESFAGLRLAELGDEFHQNYVWFRGRVERDGRGFRAVCTEPARIERAGPEPG